MLLSEDVPFKLKSISFLYCSMEDADEEGFHITRPPSVVSNRGYVAHLLMLASVECSSLSELYDIRDEKLPLSELSYPLLETDDWRDGLFTSL